jgi:hypothetical protein
MHRLHARWLPTGPSSSKVPTMGIGQVSPHSPSYYVSGIALPDITGVGGYNCQTNLRFDVLGRRSLCFVEPVIAIQSATRTQTSWM